MKRKRGKVGRRGPDVATYEAVSLDAVVLEQIFFSCGAGPRQAEERLRRRRLLRRLLRRPAARIAGGGVKRKRLLDRLGREMLGPQFRDLRQQCRSDLRRVLTVTRPARPSQKRTAPAPASRAARWSYAGGNGRIGRR